MSMVSPERIPVSEKEHAAIEKLQEKHKDQNLTLTRRDPGESGPIVVHAGDDSYTISKAGKATKLKAN